MKRIIFTFLFLATIIVLVLQTNFGHLIRTGDIEQIAKEIQSYGWIAIFVSMGAIVIQTFFPVVPFVLLAGANVIAFGLWFGFSISWVSAVAAALSNFLIARYALRDWAESKMGHHQFVRKLNNQAETKGFWIILFSRLIPVLPSSAINTAAGISKVSFRSFFFATILGKLPAVFFESILGHFVINWEENKGKLVLIFAGLLLFTFALKFFKRKKITLRK